MDSGGAGFDLLQIKSVVDQGEKRTSRLADFFQVVVLVFSGIRFKFCYFNW
jgi:hypothetical protein